MFSLSFVIYPWSYIAMTTVDKLCTWRFCSMFVSVHPPEQLRLSPWDGGSADDKALGPWPSQAADHRARWSPELWPSAQTEARLPQRLAKSCQNHRRLDHHQRHKHRCVQSLAYHLSDAHTGQSLRMFLLPSLLCPGTAIRKSVAHVMRKKKKELVC